MKPAPDKDGGSSTRIYNWLLKGHIKPILLGLKHAFFGLYRGGKLLSQSSIARHRLFVLLFGNGTALAIFWLLNYILTLVLSLLPEAPGAQSQESFFGIATFVLSFLYVLVYIAVYLIYICAVVVLALVMKPINSFCHLDIATEADKLLKIKAVCVDENESLVAKFSASVADSLYTLILLTFLLLQGFLVEAVPGIGFPLSFVHQSLLCSVFSFDYTLYSQGFSVFQRAALCQKYWTYFVGFGLPITLFLKLFVPVGFTSYFFPPLFSMYIAAAFLTKLPKASEMQPPVSVPFFMLPLFATEKFIPIITRASRWRFLSPSHR